MQTAQNCYKDSIKLQLTKPLNPQPLCGKIIDIHVLSMLVHICTIDEIWCCLYPSVSALFDFKMLYNLMLCDFQRYCDIL